MSKFLKLMNDIELTIAFSIDLSTKAVAYSDTSHTLAIAEKFILTGYKLLGGFII